MGAFVGLAALSSFLPHCRLSSADWAPSAPPTREGTSELGAEPLALPTTSREDLLASGPAGQAMPLTLTSPSRRACPLVGLAPVLPPGKQRVRHCTGHIAEDTSARGRQVKSNVRLCCSPARPLAGPHLAVVAPALGAPCL